MKFVIEKEKPEEVCEISLYESSFGVEIVAKVTGRAQLPLMRISEHGVRLFKLDEDVGIKTEDKQVKII